MKRSVLYVLDLILLCVVLLTLLRLGIAEASAHSQAQPTQADMSSAWKAYQGHAWWTLSALGIGFVVRALKDDAFVLPARFKVAAPYRPALALALGLVAGVLEKIGTGYDWRTSMLWGLSAAVTAIFSHTLIVEAARGGKDIGEKTPALGTIDLARSSVSTMPDKPPGAPGAGS